MNTKVQFKDLDIIEYGEAWNYQEKLFNEIIEQKKTSVTNNYLLFCEHPHVYTLGKNGVSNNLLINEEFLKKINAVYYKTNRGGDITYHGFGQIVGYPIFNLENFDLGVKDYIFRLEEVIIRLLKNDYNITANRLSGASGVWLDTNSKTNARKICAIGVKMSRYVTMHGFAFNINTDLSYFNHINPCGFVDKGVTSLAKELKKEIPLKTVKSKLVQYFKEVFEISEIING